MEEPYKTLDSFNRGIASLQGGNNFATRTTTIESTNFLGEQETFIVQTVRDENGDWIIMKRGQGEKMDRIIIPPKVVTCIRSQGESLTRSKRKAIGKAAAKRRKEAGIKPNMTGLNKWRKKRARSKRTGDAPVPHQ